MRIEFKNTRSCSEDPGQGMLKIKVKSIRNKRQQKKMIKKYLESEKAIKLRQPNKVFRSAKMIRAAPDCFGGDWRD